MKKGTIVWVCTCHRCTTRPDKDKRARIQWEGHGFTLYWHSVQPNYQADIMMLRVAVKHWSREGVYKSVYNR